MANDLALLIRSARRLGRNYRLVQGGGGNVSLKQGPLMRVKASGAALKDLTEKEGFVGLDYALLRRALNGGEPTDDAAYRALLAQARNAGESGRPSIESALHALLGPCVIHTHPNALLRLLCRRDALALVARLAPELGCPPLFIPYASPGLPLAQALIAAARDEGRDLAATPMVVFLANHGLFVSALDTRTALAIHERAVALAARLCPLPPLSAAKPGASSGLRRRLMLWARERGPWAAPRLPALLALRSLFASLPAADLGACFPDQVVYLGPEPLLLEGARASLWDAAWERYTTEWGQPPRVILQRDGILLFSAESRTLGRAREESWLTFGEILCGQETALARLGREPCLHLMNWESERYRAAKLAGN